MTVIVMRHGIRDARIDSPLLSYSPNDLDHSCPEVWKTVEAIAPRVTSGEIKRIITSPYLRTRQTATLVQYGLMKLTQQLLPITVDIRVGEHLNRRCSWNLPTQKDFDSETWKLYGGKVPLCRESSDLFMMRVYRFYQSMTDDTLVITHNGVAGLLGLFKKQVISLEMGQCCVLGSSTGLSASIKEISCLN